MTEKELLTTIHEGIYKANDTFTTWTDGLFLCDSAVESFMVAQVAQDIMKHGSPPPFLRLECSVADLKDGSGRPHKGRSPAYLTNRSRIDITLFNSSWQLKYAIEAKCSYGWTNAYANDLKRLIKLKKEFGKKHKKTALQAGVLAMFIHSYSQNGYDDAEANLEKHLDGWRQRIESFMLKQTGVSLTLSRSHKKPYRLDIDDCCYLASSLCAVIK